MKVLAPAFAALALSAASLSANALTTGDRYGEPANASYAERTIVVTPQTKFINVTHGEVVKVKAGSQEFAWNFDGLAQPFELNKIAPEGALDHSVRVYVGASAQDGGFGD
ncbi:MAG TPA: CzcE family metal-binding protein [Burkholderiales bacterium]|nr:CzcE family metal-binding protein [Burkholderiales bacterium]